MIPITIFTPTYNRANLLPRLYKSLCAQTQKNFEWLVVDDGSTDNTAEIVESFVAEQKITIRYVQKENGGKHTAINHGTRKADGELFFIADSDDYLPKDSVENVLNCWNDLKKNKTTKEFSQYAGICGRDGFGDGTMVGIPFPWEVFDSTPREIDYVYKIPDDMKEVFRTSVMLEFPFPEVIGERFCPEILVWNRICSKYKLRYINKIIYTAEYQPCGLTDTIVRIRMKAPIASMMTYSEMFVMDIPIVAKIKASINYWRFAYCTNKRSVKIASWGNVFAPLGWAMHIKDLYEVK